MNNNKRKTIAIVCNERDCKHVESIALKIQQNNYDIWYTPKSITGYNTLDCLARNTLSSDLLIAFISSNFLFNSWQKKIIDFAKINKKTLLLVYIDNLSSKDLPEKLQVFYSDSFTLESAWSNNELADDINNILDKYLKSE